MSRLPTSEEIAASESLLDAPEALDTTNRGLNTDALETERRRAERRAQRTSSDRRSSLTRLAIGWIAGIAFLSVLVAQQSVPIDDLLLDQTDVNGGRWFDGMVTSLGILAWTAAGCACVAAGYASRVAGRTAARRTLLSGGVIIGFLMLDDLFQLHSNVLPRYIGGSKLTFVALEALAILLWAGASLTELRRTRYELLLAAAAGLGGSVVIDVVNVFSLERLPRLILEDGAKFLGLLALALWATSTAADVIRSIARRSA